MKVVRYLVAIKSGPNWGNSSQYQSLRANFKRAVIVQNQAHSALKNTTCPRHVLWEIDAIVIKEITIYKDGTELLVFYF